MWDGVHALSLPDRCAELDAVWCDAHSRGLAYLMVGDRSGSVYMFERGLAATQTFWKQFDKRRTVPINDNTHTWLNIWRWRIFWAAGSATRRGYTP